MRQLPVVVLAAVLAFTMALSGDTLNSRLQTEALDSISGRYFGVVSQVESGGKTILRIDGVITRAVAHDFNDRIEALPAHRPAVIELNSPGGFTEAGHALIETIVYQRRRGRPIATAVHRHSACASMCVGIYMAGYPRYADPSAQFMVHAPRGEKTGLVRVRATAEMINRLASLGVSTRWLDHVRRRDGFSGRVDFRQSAQELVSAGANIVTSLLSGSRTQWPSGQTIKRGVRE
jgi:ATP-dependent Clp protease, protease subunit